jgi:hypothetical protein
LEVLLEEVELDKEWLLDEDELEEEELSTLSDLSRADIRGSMFFIASSHITRLFDARGVVISSAE